MSDDKIKEAVARGIIREMMTEKLDHEGTRRALINDLLDGRDARDIIRRLFGLAAKDKP